MHINRLWKTTEPAMSAGSLSGSALSGDVIASSGITFHLWRLYQHAWLVCLIFPLVALLGEPHPAWQLVVGLVALLFFAVSYTWLMWPHPASLGARLRARSRLSLFLFALLAVLASVASLIFGPAWFWLFIGVSAIAGLLLPLRWAFAAVVCFTLLPLLMAVGMHKGIDWWWIIALMLLVRGLGLDMIGIAQMGHAIRELHLARRELARLKVEEERLRLARDVHDLLGQSLSVITLKSEVARGLITEDPARCAQELAEIEQVGRMMLREVRKTVAGYRQPTLAQELDGVCQLLEAAGIAYDIEYQQEALPLLLDTVLAWVVREGVTNVLRHSQARHCLLRFTCGQGTIGVEVLNDGEQGERMKDAETRGGSGLLGVRERVEMVGGTMEAGPLLLSGTPHFRLRVGLPMQQQMEVLSLQEER